MYLTILLVLLGFILLSWDVTRSEKNPWMILSGMALILTSTVLHLFSGEGLLHAATGISAELGVGLLLAAALATVRKAGGRPFFALGLLALGLAGLLNGSARLFGVYTAAPEATTFLLELGFDDRIEEITPILNRFDARAEVAFPGLTLAQDEDLAQVFLVYVAPASVDDLMAALQADAENVDFVEPNRSISMLLPVEADTPSSTPNTVLENDPLASRQWGLDAIHAHEAHALLKDRTPVRKAVVAIVDTGVDAVHEDVRAAFKASPAQQDWQGHGTHCAGIAGAVTNNGVGVASLNWEGRYLDIAAYQALDASGMGTIETVAQAVIDAARDGVDVISMSLGDFSPTPPKVMAEAVAFARRNGVIVLASAGNSNQDAALHTPSNIEGILVISAVDENLRKARFSNTNTTLARPLAAPGVNILSMKPNNQYVSLSGTSMSTPMVAGLVGIMRSLNPDLTEAEAFEILHETGTTVGDSGQVGRVINAEAALQAVLNPS